MPGNVLHLLPSVNKLNLHFYPLDDRFEALLAAQRAEGHHEEAETVDSFRFFPANADASEEAVRGLATHRPEFTRFL